MTGSIDDRGDHVRHPYLKPFVRNLDAAETEGKPHFAGTEFTIGISEFGPS